MTFARNRLPAIARVAACAALATALPCAQAQLSRDDKVIYCFASMVYVASVSKVEMKHHTDNEYCRDEPRPRTMGEYGAQPGTNCYELHFTTRVERVLRSNTPGPKASSYRVYFRDAPPGTGSMTIADYIAKVRSERIVVPILHMLLYQEQGHEWGLGHARPFADADAAARLTDAECAEAMKVEKKPGS